MARFVFGCWAQGSPLAPYNQIQNNEFFVVCIAIAIAYVAGTNENIEIGLIKVKYFDKA